MATRTPNINSPQAAKEPRSKKQSWLKLFAFIFGLLTGIIFTGFFFFVRTVTSQNLPNPVQRADGIVVLTGTGGGRLEAGAKLLMQEKGERLLISGVNRDISREEILDVLNLPDKLSNCCVDMDFAQDTIENAQKTSVWAQALGFEHILLVTSAYHMPRAQGAITAASGRMKITPYPVRDDKFRQWWKHGSQIKRLIREYGKLLVSFVHTSSDKTIRNPISLNLPKSGGKPADARLDSTADSSSDIVPPADKSPSDELGGVE